MNFPLVLSTAQMRAFDAGATARTGLPSLILMENAGRGVADLVRERCPGQAHRPRVVGIACGAGNNGGDGFAIARHLAPSLPRGAGGYDVQVLLAAPRARITGDAATMLRALDGLAGVSVVDLSSASEADWARALAPVDVVVDALLGTGLRDDVRGVFASAIAAINARAALTIAVDIPSGLDADTGRAHGCAVRADLTATMGARKLGLVLEPTASVGELRVVDLGVPMVPPPEPEATAFWIDEAGVRPAVPPRASTAYKGTAGHLIVVAGSEGKTGAAWLTARAALRAGAGLVTVASTAAGQIALDAKVVEAMTARFTDGDDADGSSYAAIEALLAAPSVRGLALGPGIPTGVGMGGLVNRLAREAKVPMVIDAGGLNLLGERAADRLKGAASPRIVTPHPGEMGRLIGRSTADVQADRLGCARAFAAGSGAIVVLKGARTLVVTPTGQAFVNPAVEPALGTAGSGDVLTGVVGALLAQGLPPLDAAIAGVFLHGRAGARAGKTHGAPGTIASDLPEAIAAVRATLSA